MTASIEFAVQAWRTILGPEQVLDAEQSLSSYGCDTGGALRSIPATLVIVDAAQLPDVMRIAHQYKIAVYPISTGKNWGYGSSLPARNNCVIIDLSKLDRITHFDSEFGIVTLEPGVTQAMLAKFLDNGQYDYMVPVTGAGPSCSLLGNALERGYGATPHVDHFGAVTDLEAVLADGSQYKGALHEAAGEQLARLHKWGIGPYCAGLFTQGNFGIVTRMSIALVRRPECIKVCLFSLEDDSLLEEAAGRIRQIINQLPGTVGAINLMNQRRVLSMTAPFPADQVNPDGLIPEAVLRSLGRKYQVLPWTGFGTLYGTHRIVKAAQKEIKTNLAGIASRLIFISPEKARLLGRAAKLIPGQFGRGLQGMTATLAKSLELVSGRPNETALALAYWRNQKTQQGPAKNPALDGCGLLWYAPLVPMRAGDVRAYVNMVKEITARHGFEPLITFTTLSDRLFDSTVPLVFERSDPAAVAAVHACYTELVEAGRLKGWFPYRLGIDGMPILQMLAPNARSFLHKLKQGLDPDNLIAPGRYD